MTEGGEVNTNETLPSIGLEAVPRPRCPDDPTNLTEIFGRFLRLCVAEGDAPPKGIFVSPATIRTYHAQAAQFVAWCQQQGLSASIATENDIIAYRKYLVETGYKPATIALKLAVVRRLYEAIQWRGLRDDNPAAGVKAPRDRSARDERAKYLPLDGLKQLLAAPQGDGPLPRRNRAILALMGVHGLRVSEVAGLNLDDVDLNEGVARVLGKGRKVRTVYLTDQTTQVLAG